MRCFSDSHAHVRQVARVVRAQLPNDATHVVSPALPHRVVVCGTHPSIDWLSIAQLADQTVSLRSSSSSSPSSSPCQLICGFGVHPWFVETAKQPDKDTVRAIDDREADDESSAYPGCQCANTRSPQADTQSSTTPSLAPSPCMSLEAMLSTLELHLQRYPHALVGEIGLDKLRGPPESVQVAAFLAQMRLAARYQRPVSVHCVRHHGLLLQLLQGLSAEETPPAIILHGFTGSLEVVKSLLKLKNKQWMVPASADGQRPPRSVKIKDRLYFGVGASTSFRVKQFATDTLPLLLSEGRALLETDEHYHISLPQAERDPQEKDHMTVPDSAIAGLDEVQRTAELISAEACAAMEAAFDRAFSTVMLPRRDSLEA